MDLCIGRVARWIHPDDAVLRQLCVLIAPGAAAGARPTGVDAFQRIEKKTRSRLVASGRSRERLFEAAYIHAMRESSQLTRRARRSQLEPGTQEVWKTKEPVSGGIFFGTGASYTPAQHIDGALPRELTAQVLQSARATVS
jgi:hypothetical protein